MTINPINLEIVYGFLTSFAGLSSFWQTFETIYGSNYDRQKAEEIRSQWLLGDFSSLPPIQIVDSSTLGSASGGYATDINTIFLSENFLVSASFEQIVAVLLEEIGHYVDAQVNVVDTAGDEGEYFSLTVLAKDISQFELSSIKTEDDGAVIYWQGEQIEIEKADLVIPFGNSYVNRGVFSLEGDFISNNGGTLYNGTAGLTAYIYSDSYIYNGDPNPPDGELDRTGYIYNGVNGFGYIYNGYDRGQIGHLYNGLFSSGHFYNSRGIPGTRGYLYNGHQESTGHFYNGYFAGGYFYNGTGSTGYLYNGHYGTGNFYNGRGGGGSGYIINGDENVENSRGHIYNGYAGRGYIYNGYAGRGYIYNGNGSYIYNGYGDNGEGFIYNGFSFGLGYIYNRAGGYIYNGYNATGAISNGSNTSIGYIYNEVGGTIINYAHSWIANSLDSYILNDGTIDNRGDFFNFGTLAGSGVFIGDLIITDVTQFSAKFEGGILAPGGNNNNGYTDTDGTFTIQGDFAQSGSAVLSLSLTNTSSFDVLKVTGNANFSGGFINLIGLSAFASSGFNSGTTNLILVDGDSDNDGEGILTIESSLIDSLNNAVDTYDVFSTTLTRDFYVQLIDNNLVLSITQNLAPTDLELSANSVNENVPAGTIIGNLSSTDPDGDNTFTYSLVSGVGATDNDAFTIDENQLKIINSPDFETKSSYSIRVQTTDQGGLSYEKVFTINILNVNEINEINGSGIIRGTVDNDLITASPNADRTYAGDGDDCLFGLNGNDLLYGEDGNDYIDGGNGADRLYGGNGNDILLGQAGNDLLYGGDGDDLLIGGSGNDRLFGQGGNDTFVIEKANGRDIIADYQDGEDKLGLLTTDFSFTTLNLDVTSSTQAVLKNELDETLLSFQQYSSSVRIFNDTGNFIATLSNTALGVLDAGDFVSVTL